MTFLPCAGSNKRQQLQAPSFLLEPVQAIAITTANETDWQGCVGRAQTLQEQLEPNAKPAVRQRLCGSVLNARRQRHSGQARDGVDAKRSDLRTFKGIPNLSSARSRITRSRGWLQAWHDAVQTLAQPDGQLHLTFEILYGHAVQSSQTHNQAGDTMIDLAHMRRMLLGKG